MDLPFIDAHEIEAPGSPGPTWQALLEVLPAAFGGQRTRRLARWLGCQETEVVGLPLQEGSAVAGFRVVELVPEQRIVLEGNHRFSTYRLTFELHAQEPETTRLTARTWAAFPGLSGTLYRAAVIGTRGHVLVTKRILSAVARRAAGRQVR